MSGIKKYLIWFIMLSKRLIKKPGFIILLILIPLMMPFVNLMITGESGMLNIALVNEDISETGERIIKNLTGSESIINYTVCENKNEAVKMVETKKADAAWILSKDIDKKTDKYIASKIPFAEVIEREETIPLKISREIFYGALYDEISFSMYKNYVYENVIPENEITEEKLKYYYYVGVNTSGVVDICKLGTEEPIKSSGMLLTPVRGILSLMIIICQIAAAMFYLKDKKEGKFDWLPSGKRIIPAFASCFSAGIMAGITVVASFVSSGMLLKPDKEIISMILYIFSSTCFCLILCCLFDSPTKLGAVTPGIVILMLALSPVFFSVKELKLVRILIPSHYYLYSLYNSEYYLYFVWYIISSLVLLVALNFIASKKRRKTSLI